MVMVDALNGCFISFSDMTNRASEVTKSQNVRTFSRVNILRAASSMPPSWGLCFEQVWSVGSSSSAGLPFVETAFGGGGTRADLSGCSRVSGERLAVKGPFSGSKREGKRRNTHRI